MRSYAKYADIDNETEIGIEIDIDIENEKENENENENENESSLTQEEKRGQCERGEGKPINTTAKNFQTSTKKG